MEHLVYCDDKANVLEKICKGEKRMVVRGAAGRKIPHSRVFAGETLYFMKKGSKKISAKAVVTDVENFVKLTDEEIDEKLAERQELLQLTAAQIKRWHKKCLCFVTFDQVEEMEPMDFDHQGNMDDWLIVEQIADVVVGTSKPFNYEASKFKK